MRTSAETRLLLPRRLKLAVLQDVQQLALQARLHLADFVEHQRCRRRACSKLADAQASRRR